VFVFSDGQISNYDGTIEMIKRNAQWTRIFAFGIRLLSSFSYQTGSPTRESARLTDPL
jgi:hypothetical protein